VYATDSGRVLRTTDGGKLWNETYSYPTPDGNWTTSGIDVTTCYGVHFDPFDARRMFISYTDIGLWASDTAGASWYSTTRTGVPRQWVNTTYWMEFDPAVRGRIWAVMSGTHDLPRPKMWRRASPDSYTGGVVRSDDGGRTWRVQNNGMPQTAATHILREPSGALYVTGFGRGVFKSTDGGEHWSLKNAGIEGAQPQSQRNASFAINTNRGGNTARVIVVPEKGPFDKETAKLRPELERLASQTAKDIGAQEVVGGPAVLLDDFDSATTARFPFLVLTLVVVTFLVLLLLFRAPVLALVAVLLNLVTVGAAVGVLILGFQTDPPPLGGPGYLDAIALSGIFAIIFGLSIDYEVFLISRLVEGRALTGTTDGAIRYGLEKTATIITGAAAVMTFVFLAFAVSPVANTRQFGIGLTVAVVLDATVVRLILLPALIRLFGERTWATPPWLDRILPRISTH